MIEELFNNNNNFRSNYNYVTTHTTNCLNNPPIKQQPEAYEAVRAYVVTPSGNNIVCRETLPLCKDAIFITHRPLYWEKWLYTNQCQKTTNINDWEVSYMVEIKTLLIQDPKVVTGLLHVDHRQIVAVKNWTSPLFTPDVRHFA
ncbi:hypothetical protein Tco_0543077 [Tanacetum coccineum]